MNPLIVLDAGHGGRDFGAVAGQRIEKQDNLKMTLAVQAHLENMGCRLVLTRRSDVAVSPNMRAVLANGAGADLLISLHRCSSALAGVQVWANRDARDGAIVEELLQNLSRLGLSCEERSRGGEGCHLLQRAEIPAVRVVLGRLDSEADNRLLDEKLTDCAKAIAEAVCSALGFEAMRPAMERVSQRIR